MMTWFSVSTGYRAGGNNTAPGVNPTWAPEKLTAYELGLKSVLADGAIQLNTSLWHNDFKDVQSQSFLVMPYPGSPEATEYTGNGGPLSATGVDFEDAVDSKPRVGPGDQHRLHRRQFRQLHRGQPGRAG